MKTFLLQLFENIKINQIPCPIPKEQESVSEELAGELNSLFFLTIFQVELPKLKAHFDYHTCRHSGMLAEFNSLCLDIV